MARDYKHAGTSRKSKPRPVGSWVSFASGLALGLVVAFGVFVFYAEPGGEIAGLDAISPDDDGALVGESFEEAVNRSLPKREFDFYKILPEIEVKVPDWEDLGVGRSDRRRSGLRHVRPAGRIVQAVRGRGPGESEARVTGHCRHHPPCRHQWPGRLVPRARRALFRHGREPGDAREDHRRRQRRDRAPHRG